MMTLRIVPHTVKESLNTLRNSDSFVLHKCEVQVVNSYTTVEM